MTLKEFVREYVCPNTLIRLWVPLYGGGHRMLFRRDEEKPGNVDDVCMEHELLSSKSWLSRYSLCEVVGVTDIVITDGFYREAVNIVIKPLSPYGETCNPKDVFPEEGSNLWDL